MGYFKTIRSKFSAEITVVPGFLQSKNYPALTGVRGVAIIIVLLYHLGINRLLRHFNCWILGRLGVDIFFVLSGFLITTLLIKEKITTNHISLKKFYIRRALRIIPVAYLFLVVMIVINNLFKCGIGLKSFVCGFLFVKNLPITGINDHWTTHLWSLSVEEQFYLFFPLLLLININKTAVFTIVMVLSVLVFSLLGFHHVGIFYSIPVLYQFCRAIMYFFWEGPLTILIGCLFSILSFNGIINVGQLKNKYLLSGILFIIAVIIHSKTFYFYTTYLSEFLFAVLIGFVILLSINSDNLFTRLLNSRFLIWMGTLSYSIYIWQQIFVWIPMPLENKHLWGLGFNTLFILTDMIRLLGMLSTACLSYYFFERIFLRLKVYFV
jgi:peptidoglycan/LPS O-acetylase OafA/YrhL